MKIEKNILELMGYRSFFKNNPREITCGMEMELYLCKINKDGKIIEPINDDSIMEYVLKQLPEEITRDYYPNQIELRTNPHDNPEDMIKEIKSLMQQMVNVTHTIGCGVFPISWLGGKWGEMYNGIHFHVRSKKNNFYNTMINSYPFILSIASKFRDSPYNYNTPSKRICSSHHIGLPYLNKRDFLSNSSGTRRYKDMSINKTTNEDNTPECYQKRLKKVYTLETRMFDVPSEFAYLENLIKHMFKVFQYIDIRDNKLETLWKEEYIHLADETRYEIGNYRHPVNHFFGTYCFEVVNTLSNYFNIPKIDWEIPIKRNKNYVGNLIPTYKDVLKKYNFLKEPVKNQINHKLFLKKDPSTQERIVPLFMDGTQGFVEELRRISNDRQEYIPDEELIFVDNQ